MAIVSVNEIAGREGTLDALDGYKRTYTRSYLVKSNDAGESEVAVRSASGVPLIGASHPFDSRAYCVRKRCSQRSKEAERKLWVVTCEFATLKRDDKKKVQHPLDRPYEIDWRGETFQTIAEKDKFNRGIVNSAGQYFDPPIQVDNVRPVLTITRNEPSFSGSLAATYQEAINTDPFLGGAPYTVKCKSINAKRVIEEFTVDESTVVEVEFWTVTYEFHYWWRTWWLFPLDQGRYELGSGGTELTPVQDSLGQNVTDPVPLDGNGQALPPNTLPDSAVYLTYRYYRELPFAAFGF